MWDDGKGPKVKLRFERRVRIIRKSWNCVQEGTGSVKISEKEKARRKVDWKECVGVLLLDDVPVS